MFFLPNCDNSLGKHPFLLALRRWGRFSGEERGETDVFAGYCDKHPSATCFCPPMWLLTAGSYLGPITHYILTNSLHVFCYTYWYISPDCDRFWNWKKREPSISHSNHQWPCSRENNLALLQDKLDSIKHLNEKTKYFFTRLFRQLYILDRFSAN